MCSVVREPPVICSHSQIQPRLHRRTQIKNKRWASDACLILICDYLRKSAAESGFSPAASGTEPGNRRPSNKSLPVTTGSCSWWIEITFSR